jgi:hypothetical protein
MYQDDQLLLRHMHVHADLVRTLGIRQREKGKVGQNLERRCELDYLSAGGG